MKTLSVTEASKSLGEFVKRVHSRKETFTIVRLGVPYACLVPASGLGCSSHELAAELTKADLPTEEKRALGAAVRKGRKVFKPLRNPWG
jgi:PHD/YefM family antitoxin component YafN of YafNO toxin-antitoxin module